MSKKAKKISKIIEHKDTFKKDKFDLRLVLKKLNGELKQYRWIIFTAILIAIVATILLILGPTFISEITDLITKPFEDLKIGILSEIDIAAITVLAITLVIMYSVSFVANTVQGILMNQVSMNTTRNLRTKLDNKINKTSIKILDKNNVGDQLSQFTNDIDLIGNSLAESMATMINAIVGIIGAAIAMFITNWIMAFVAIGSSIISIGLMGLIMGKTQLYFNQQQGFIGKVNGHIEEHYTGHSIVKVYNGTVGAKADFQQLNNQLYNSAWKAQFSGGLAMPLMSFVNNFGYVAVVVAGAVLVFEGHASFGVITSFMIYINLFTNPISNLGMSAISLQKAGAAANRVFNTLDQEEMELENDKENIDLDFKGDVEFINVAFGYNEDKMVIHNFSQKIKAGNKVAIVGPTGAGKTTLVNLLMRFYELNSGSILIDGYDISKFKREQIHSLFGMVLQDTWTFEGTIRENLIYNTKDISEQRLKEVANLTGISHFINSLSDGYDTVINDNTSLSAGQKQLLTIARAMLKDSPLLILDEATSSIDTRTELLIQSAIDKLTANRTSFVIAHRLSTIKNADIILVMNHGDIVESGNHDQLMIKNGFYAELYNSQFNEELE